MDPAPISTFASLTTTFTDFLTTAIHTILYERSLYPRTAFLCARKYNHPVRQCRHPAVCAWITDAVAAVEAQLLAGAVARVAVVLYSPRQRPLERFVFDVSRFPVVARGDTNTTFAPRDGGGKVNGVRVVDLEEQFRAVMARLSVCGTVLGPLPEGCSFTVAVELKEKTEPPLGHPQPWIPVPPSLQEAGREGDAGGKKRGEDLGGAKTVPVRAVEAGEMVFEMWIEEGREKVEKMRGEASSAGSG